MTELPIDYPEKHQAFLKSSNKHVLMITNHGIHQWKIIPGLRDTGGQNVFVNQFAAALADQGFKITIANRGGYPHPKTGEPRRGLTYKNADQRILYLEDSSQEFVRKEDMVEQIPELVDFLYDFLQDENTDIDLIISHYWDAAKIGVAYNRRLQEPVKHIWVPHSLGKIKKRNVSKDEWADLRIDERIEIETDFIPELDGVAATSSAIRESLEDDYDCSVPILFLPPSINTDRFHPRDVSEDDQIWHFLSNRSGLSPARIQECKIVAEISRTDTTKRKDVLIKAFAQAHEDVPDSLLVVSIDETEEALATDLKQLINDCNVAHHTIVVGNIQDILPTFFAVIDIYCTPSIMEGFGMSAQEAAATRVPIVASHLVPFVVEYLLGDEVERMPVSNNEHKPLRQGEGAIVVEADEVDGFARALTSLLKNDSLRQEMAEKAYEITIPYFTWEKMVNNFLDAVGIAP